MPKPWGPTTTAIHAGKRFNTTRAVTTPIFQTSVFQLMENSEGAEFSASVEPPAFYTRWGNPNTSEVEAVLAELEGAERALATASGMAAFALVFEALLKPGDHLVAPAAIYLGTEQLIRRWEAERGLKVTWVQNTLDLAEWEAALQPETRMIWVETPSNPTLALTDLAGVAALGKKHGVRTVADNTFPSPIHTRPLAFGIDLSVASATKYWGGTRTWWPASSRGPRLTSWPAGTSRRSWVPPWIPWPPGCCTAASRHWPCGCGGLPTTPRPWPSGCSGSPT